MRHYISTEHLTAALAAEMAAYIAKAKRGDAELCLYVGAMAALCALLEVLREHDYDVPSGYGFHERNEAVGEALFQEWLREQAQDEWLDRYILTFEPSPDVFDKN